MGTVAADLDLCQKKTHDSGTLWTRAELLRWYNDAYKQLIVQSGALTRLLILDVPGRHTFSFIHPWEDRHASGTSWQAFFSVDRYVCTTLWEAEQHGYISSPADSLTGITYQWERYDSDEVDQHYQFGLPKNHDLIVRLAYDDHVLLPIEVRELDQENNKWMKTVGRPDWWTTGIGRTDSVEIYEIVDTYTDNYEHYLYERGTPRALSGDRTWTTKNLMRLGNEYAYTHSGDVNAAENKPIYFAGLGWRFTYDSEDTTYYTTQIWEKQALDGDTLTAGATAVTYWWETEYASLSEVDFSLGVIRRLDSPDRQYVPVADESGQYGVNGIIREWKSSEDALLFHQRIIPTVDLTENDTPGLIPSQLQKYLRYYVLSRAFGRTGEGQNQALAAMYDLRFQRGITIFSRLGNVAFKDMVYVRQDVDSQTHRPPRVRLPSEYPRIW